MKKLELKHLAGYLPYKLQICWNKGFNNIEMWTGNIDKVLQLSNDWQDRNDRWKPILRPLSDLIDKVGEINGFSLSDMITHGAHNDFWTVDKFSLNHLYVHDLEILLKFHFDIHGLIEAGLAVDINTLQS